MQVKTTYNKTQLLRITYEVKFLRSILRGVFYSGNDVWADKDAALPNIYTVHFQILRKAKTRVIVKRFLNRKCSNH